MNYIKESVWLLALALQFTITPKKKTKKKPENEKLQNRIYFPFCRLAVPWNFFFKKSYECNCKFPI